MGPAGLDRPASSRPLVPRPFLLAPGRLGEQQPRVTGQRPCWVPSETPPATAPR